MRVDQQGRADLDDDAPGLGEADAHGCQLLGWRRRDDCGTALARRLRSPSSSFFIAVIDALAGGGRNEQRRLADPLLEIGELCCKVFRVGHIDLVEGDDLGLFGKQRL